MTDFPGCLLTVNGEPGAACGDLGGVKVARPSRDDPFLGGNVGRGGASGLTIIYFPK